MKKLVSFIFASLLSAQAFGACAPFTPNVILTAAALNAALASPCITSGTINGVVIGGATPAAVSGTAITATSIANSGLYTQSGTGVNLFTGPISFGAGSQLAGGNLGLGAGGVLEAGSGQAFIVNTAPVIGSGFGTTPFIANSNGTVSFAVNVGTGGTASSGVITLPAVTTNWNCDVINSLSGVGTLTQQSAHTATSVTLTNYTIATDVAVAWPASYVIELNCMAK